MKVKKYGVSMFTKNKTKLWFTRSLKIAMWLYNLKRWECAKITEIYEDNSNGSIIAYKKKGSV